MKKIFLLGGHDLEMVTIQNLLLRSGHTFFDKALQWNNAYIDQYADDIKDFANREDIAIYAIELQYKHIPAISNLTIIDHHNDLSHLPSALEQVAELLGVQPDKRMSLIAANDKGYIPAMEKLGASKEEINEIRTADRKAQGVTAEDEQLAEQAVNSRKTYGNLTVVECTANKFSPVCDMLYPYGKLMVYNDTELMYYGEGADKVFEAAAAHFGKEKIFRGGGPDGFVGVKKNEAGKEKITKFIQYLTEKGKGKEKGKSISYHIFHYPFQWRKEGSEHLLLSEQIDISGIEFNECSMWERVQTPSPDDAADVYNERNYYYKFVHNILYDDSSTPVDLIRHFERREPQMGGDVTYKIKLKSRNTPYVLKVEAMNINFYSTGIGIMSFYMSNNDSNQAKPEDILNINQFGRRIMPPFFSDIEDRKETAEYICIEGLKSNNVYFEDFSTYAPDDYWKSATFINKLINEVATNITCTPVIDDRMFVCSWYKNDDLAKVFTDNDKAYLDDSSFSDFWYRYLFVDGVSATCQNEDMKKELLTRHTYTRWQKWSSLYGVSRYSMVYLTNKEAPPFLLQNFITIYIRMIELVLLQRASILRFSAEVTLVSTLKQQKTAVLAERINSLYKEYIQFLNQIYFREVTSQDQGIELYTLFQKTLELDNYIKDLDGEIEELHNYISLRIENKRSRNGEWLNIIAGIFLPATVFTGLFGMNPLPGMTNIQSMLVEIILIVVLTILAIYYINKKSK